MAFFDSYFWPFNKTHEKIIAIFFLSAIMASIWNVFIKFRWRDEKLTNGQPQFYLHENPYPWIPYTILYNLVMRTNPFSLEELATVKTAVSGVDPESLRLPKMIEDKLKTYQAFIKISKSSMCIAGCILEVRLFGATSFDSLQRR